MHRTLPLLVFAALLSVTASAQRRIGSIYDPNSGGPLALADKTAAQVGDLITVIINETQDVRNEERAAQSKGSSLNYSIANLDLKPDLFRTLPSLEATKADTFSGTANVEKRGNFTARLTAMVIDTLPNGNLVVQGRRELRIDGFRRFDVTRSNTVQSELVADARISYVGQGPGRRATERRGLAKWLHMAVDWIWPF